MQDLFVIGNPLDGFITFVCEGCADKWGTTNGLEWSHSHRNYTEEHPSEMYAYRDSFGEAQSDHAVACEDCGEWLDADLTEDGLNWLVENFDRMPMDVLRHYLAPEVFVTLGIDPPK